MASWGLLLISLAYLIGLLATGITDAMILNTVSVAGCIVLVLSGMAGFLLPRLWCMGPTAKQWWIAGLVGLIGASYCVLKEPQPAANDISHFVSRQERVLLGRVFANATDDSTEKGALFL